MTTFPDGVLVFSRFSDVPGRIEDGQPYVIDVWPEEPPIDPDEIGAILGLQAEIQEAVDAAVGRGRGNGQGQGNGQGNGQGQDRRAAAADDFTVKELKALAKDAGLRGYSKMRETELIELLQSNGVI